MPSDEWSRAIRVPDGMPGADVINAYWDKREAHERKAVSVTYDTASNHVFDSWTDADLYRAIDAPENSEPGEHQEVEIAEYVAELKSRKAARDAQAAREERLRSKYRI